MRTLSRTHHPGETVIPVAKHAPAARHLGGIKRLDPTPLDYSDLRDDDPDPLSVLHDLLAEPAPRTDWLYLLGAVESATLTSWSRVATDATRALDTIHNVTLFAEHQAVGEFVEQLDALDGTLVDAYAALIQSEATL